MFLRKCMSFSQYNFILSHYLHIPYTLHFCNYKIQYMKFATSKSTAYMHVIFWIFTNSTFPFKSVQFYSTLNVQYCHYTFSTHKKSIYRCPYRVATGILDICNANMVHTQYMSSQTISSISQSITTNPITTMQDATTHTTVHYMLWQKQSQFNIKYSPKGKFIHLVSNNTNLVNKGCCTLYRHTCL